MKTLNRIAKPCGIVGGVWGILAPILMLFSSPPWAFVRIWWYLPILSFVILMGVLALVAIVLSKRRLHLGRIFIWVSALAVLVVSFLGLFTWGLFFLPASILLILAAIGIRKREEPQLMEAK